METLNSRKIAREIIMHLSYGYSYSNQSIEEYWNLNVTEDKFESMKEEYDIYSAFPNEELYAYMKEVFFGVAEHAAELDEFIAKYAVGWKFERISLVANAIMRVAMYEILYFNDVPQAVAVNEAVEICKKYEDDNTANFVNAILRNFIRNEVKNEF